MNIVKQGFIYYLLATILGGLLLLFYIQGDSVASTLDATGWVFYVLSCFSHAAILMLALWLIFFLPWALLKLRRLAAILLVTATSLLMMTGFINMQVYKIYRFHLNGFILNMLTGPAAGDIFDFSWQLYATEGLMLAFIVALCIGGWWLSGRILRHWQKRYTTISILSLVATLLIANGIHIYGSFIAKPSILKVVKLVPYYFPLSTSNLLEDMGFRFDFSERPCAVATAVPTFIMELDMEEIIAEIAKNLRLNKHDPQSHALDDLLHTVACKSAIRGNDKNTPEELQALADRVYSDDTIRHCPHGRPVIFTLSKSNIERQFGRA